MTIDLNKGCPGTTHASDDMVCVLDLQQRCVSVNEAFLLAFGKQENELLGQCVTASVARECIAELIEGSFDSALAGEHASTKRWRDFPHLGFRYVRIDVDPLRDGADSICGATVHIRDLTDARLAQEALEESEQRFDDFSEIVSDWLWELDGNLRFVYLSARFEEIMGMPREQVLGRRRIELFPEEDHAGDATREHHRTLEQHLPFDGYQFTRILEDGAKRSIRMSGKPNFDGQGRFLGYRGIAEDITQARHLESRIAHLASHDALTGLVNRQEFLLRLERVVDTASDGESEHGLCYVDVDRFRMVNDRCGHAAGDQLLKDLAELLQQRIRRRDTLARVGGNTFTILMEHCSLAQIERVAEAVHRATRDYGFGHRDEAVNFTVTISVVAIDARSRSVDRVLKAADRACYAAKSAGGDRVLVHGHSDRQAARERRGAFIV
jgi:diguanylate cyclase (GGDEF)-like protein/PAS domain S-box-containing protein